MTLSASAFSLAGCQASAYTPDGGAPPVRVIAEVAPRWRDRFDVEPQVVAHPANPQPRVLLRDRSGGWRCELAADRIDLYWLRTASPEAAPALADFFARAAQLFAEYAELAEARIGRVAAIATRVAPHPTPGPYLSALLLRAELGGGAGRADAFELNLHERRGLGSCLVNAWIRCRTPDDPDPAARRAVVVIQDVNTLGEEAASRTFSRADLAELFAVAARDHDRVLAQLFPGA